jgi:hypothetical protein
MGGGVADVIQIALEGSLGLAQVVLAIMTWRAGRESAGRSDITIVIRDGQQRIVVEADRDELPGPARPE